MEGQIDDLIGEINQRTGRSERVLVTTLTKKMAEDLTGYLRELGIQVRYMHHDIDTMERMEIIRDLRLGEFDVLVGINLLREGLDIPEVSLVAILDADKEGFLRSETSPDPDHRPCGPERRGPGHHVRRRGDAFHGAGHHRNGAPPGHPGEVQRGERHHPPDHPQGRGGDHWKSPPTRRTEKKKKKRYTAAERQELIQKYTKEMKAAAKLLEFEHAAYLRDKIKELEGSGPLPGQKRRLPKP